MASVHRTSREVGAAGPGASARTGPTSRRRLVTSPALPLASELAMLALAGGLLGPDGLVAVGVAAAVRLLHPRPARMVTSAFAGIDRLVIQLALTYLALATVAPGLAPTAATWSGVIALAGVGRGGANVVARVARSSGRLRERIIVAGRPDETERVAAALAEREELGLEITTAHQVLEPQQHDGFDPVERLEAEAVSAGADRLLLVEKGLDSRTVRDIARAWDPAVASLHVLVEDPLQLTPASGQVDEVWGYPVAAQPVPAHRRPAWLIKSAADRVIAAVLLVVLAPVMGALALAVRLTSPGPVLFRQERVGRDGRTFTILKFRSMPVSHDQSATWNAAYGSEPTPLGRVMRATSLDELPQLINVVRGEMSLIGPRPEIPDFAHQFAASIRDYRWRHRLPVGMTGWAQVHGLRGDTSLEDRVRFDNAYIDRWSLRRELSILAMTVVQLIPERRPAAEPDSDAIDVRDQSVGWTGSTG